MSYKHPQSDEDLFYAGELLYQLLSLELFLESLHRKNSRMPISILAITKSAITLLKYSHA